MYNSVKNNLVKCAYSENINDNKNLDSQKNLDYDLKISNAFKYLFRDNINSEILSSISKFESIPSLTSESFANEYGHDCGLLGNICIDSEKKYSNGENCNNVLFDKYVYLNTSHPFCLVTCGVQGSGKSHTIGVVLENCLIPLTNSDHGNCTKLVTPMAGLVFHYDQCPTNRCEATGLISLVEKLRGVNIAPLPKEKMIVLVSPTYYKQRKLFYGNYCEVRPLLLSWPTLTAKQIKTLMKIEEDGTQLYIAAMLDLLRRYQRENKISDFESFLASLESLFGSSQNSPLKKRISLIQSLVKESNFNKDLIEKSSDIYNLFGSGRLIVADLTDPLLSSDDANGIFDILLSQFRSIDVSYGKIVLLDEAHKYLSSHSDSLTKNLVETVRLMRHEGIRIAISTQSPNVLPPELLELSNIAVLHQFHSRDWLTYLRSKLALDEVIIDHNGKCKTLTINDIMRLKTGEAIVFANRYLLKGLEEHSECIRISMRQRVAQNLGSSKLSIAH